jgi:hypothetical protein
MSLMITKRLLDVVSCEFKKKCLKKVGHVEALNVISLLQEELKNVVIYNYK